MILEQLAFYFAFLLEMSFELMSWSVHFVTSFNMMPSVIIMIYHDKLFTVKLSNSIVK